MMQMKIPFKYFPNILFKYYGNIKLASLLQVKQVIEMVQKVVVWKIYFI